MNKTAIKNFAIWARNKLIADIQYKAGLMGITEKGIANALSQSTRGTEFYDIGTSEPYTISGKEIEQRRRLKEVIENKAYDTDYSTAYKYVIEEVAYTWFNRLIAVRFMEVNDYLPGHIRVLSSETGKMEPDLVTTPFDAELEFASTEEEQIIQLKQDNKIDELFRMLFIKQCNALNELLPALFEKTNDYTEILLNLSVIDQEGVVYHLVHDIPEEDFDINRGGQVEIIGWLYQYYNTEPKNDAFAKSGKITKEEIPAVTQLFTPDWIVRYMVENSLGRLWLEGHPDDNLKAKWKYYLDEAEQDPEVQIQLDEIKKEHAKLNPEDIKLIDPCMGSGHILVYAFDVFMQIYESAGWSQRDAAKSILENNIFGLDIDDRAGQMAYFAVMMKARQYNRRIFNEKMICNLHSIKESNGITNALIQGIGGAFPENERKQAAKQAMKLIEIFQDAKEYGSLLNVNKMDWDLLRRFTLHCDNDEGQMKLDIGGEQEASRRLQEIIDIAEIMAQKYHVTITNPPYMTISNASTRLAEYVKTHYTKGKADLFAAFIEACGKMTLHNGYQAMITQQMFMFLSSFIDLREYIFSTKTIINMNHLGFGTFGADFGTTAYVLQNSCIQNYFATYINLTNYRNVDEKECNFFSKDNVYIKSFEEMSYIPNKPLAFWISKPVARSFEKGSLREISEARIGLVPGNNEYYLRLWHEVNVNDIGFNMKRDTAKNSFLKWFPYNKGGAYRKWYGNRDYIVNWYNDGYEMQTKKHPSGNRIWAHNFNLDYIFKKHIAWSDLTSGDLSFRIFEDGFIFDSSSDAAFMQDEYFPYVIAFLNTKLALQISKILNPTIHFKPGDYINLPFIKNEVLSNTEISILARENIEISKDDWNSFETSWEFQYSPLIDKKKANYHIQSEYEQWKKITIKRFAAVKANEERLNEIFNYIYGTSEEIDIAVDDKSITIRTADINRDIRNLLSYAVGCMFGRYSLDFDGLVYAGGIFDESKYSTFIPDVDGIIPITDEEYFEDDIVGLFCAWLKKVYGEETLEENLDFIAKALGKKGNCSREIIRNYFLTDFYKDHCSTYSVTGSGKRPIYWLFDSGKQNGFKALIYLHRYTPDTIGNLRVDYLHRMQRVYESEMNRMQDMIEHSTNSREVAAASKRKEKLQKQLKECREYDEKIGHLALDRIELDLDDGVKYNYRKIQTGRDGKFYEVLADSKAIMMDAKKYADFKK